MPAIVRNLIVPAAISAPVLPQLKIASAAPIFAKSIALIMDESFFERIAWIGFSLISMIWLAW